MTLQQCESRNKAILERFRDYRALDNATELAILGDILDVRIPTCVFRHFKSSNSYWYHDGNMGYTVRCTGASKTIFKTIDKLISKL